MTLTLSELKRVVAELDGVVRGGHIQKVHQPSDRAIVLQVRRPGQTYLVYLGAERNLGRVHLLSHPIPNPPTPPPFCMALRKHLVPGSIDALEVVSDDRVVRFTIVRREDDGSAASHALVLEIIPGYENIILVDEQGRAVVAMAHAATKDGRMVAPHRPYLPPPKGEAGAQAAEDRFAEDVQAGKFDSYSAAIEAAFQQEDTQSRAADLRHDVLGVLSKSQRRAERRLEKIEKDFEATGQSDLIQLKGELLKVNLASVQRGQESVELPHAGEHGEEMIVVELDPKMSPLENMQRYFRRARKLRSGRDIIGKRLEETREELALLAGLRKQLDEAAEPEQFEEIAAELRLGGFAQPKQQVRERAPVVRSQPRRFVSADGVVILVGRNPAQNDEMTLHAPGNDYWLHVQHYPGSHVIIKMDKDKPLMKETLLDAAHLAMYFSHIREATKATIDYTQRKFVKKPKGAPPGRVTISQQKSILLVPDKKRLERLLKGTGLEEIGRGKETGRKGEGARGRGRK